MNIDRRSFDLNNLIESTISEFSGLSNRYQIRFNSVVNEPLVADRFCIGQVLYNLISNAINTHPTQMKFGLRLIIVNIEKK